LVAIVVSVALVDAEIKVMLERKAVVVVLDVAATVIPAVNVVIVAVEVAVDRAASLAVAGAKLIVVVVISGVELVELAVDAMVERA
jgi:hypothetical protein